MAFACGRWTNLGVSSPGASEVTACATDTFFAMSIRQHVRTGRAFQHSFTSSPAIEIESACGGYFPCSGSGSVPRTTHAATLAAGSADPEIGAGPSVPFVADPEHAARIAEMQDV
jgi:hypothetical protein